MEKYIILAVLTIALAILMALIMRALPARWDLPLAPDTNPAGFYAVWGIFWLNWILHQNGIDYIWTRAIYFVLAYPAIHWGFQRPAQKKMIEHDIGHDDIDNLHSLVDNLERRLLGKIDTVFRNLTWKIF